MMAPKNNGTVKLKAAAKNSATVATVRMGTSEEAWLSNRVMEGSGGGLEFWMASDLWLDDLPLLRLRSARDWPEVDMLPPRRCENLPTALEGRPGILPREGWSEQKDRRAERNTAGGKVDL